MQICMNESGNLRSIVLILVTPSAQDRVSLSIHMLDLWAIRSLGCSASQYNYSLQEKNPQVKKIWDLRA